MHPFRIILASGIVIGTLAFLGCGGSSAASSPTATVIPAPSAAFSFSLSAPSVGQTITFTDASTNTPTSWAWGFGDGGTSTLQNPTHAYSASGSYTVTLSATNAGGSSTTSKSVTVGTAGSLALSSSVAGDGGMLPIDYSGDGSGASPDLSWSGSPAGTKEYALLMTTPGGPGDSVTTKYNWVLSGIPAATTRLAKSTSGAGTGGLNTHGTTTYEPPMSQGPGSKVYTFTVYALSASPALPSGATQFTGETLSAAISSITLGSTSLNLNYARQAPAAGFTSTTNGSAVAFISACGLSTTAWAWDFGDGTTSVDKNPSHTYATSGTYTVKLTATNDIGPSTTSKSLTVGSAVSFALASSIGSDGGTLPVDYTVDGSGASPDFAWSGAPSGTTEFALLMKTEAVDGTRWNWVLYHIPAATTSLAMNTSGVGTCGLSDLSTTAYAPPHSPGAGPMLYTFTLYALSATPTLPSDAAQVTGAVLTEAISSLTLGTATLNLSYSRTAPVAGFTSSVSGATATFASECGLSTTSWAWSFGDGTTSTEQSPSHTYSTSGTYTVTLAATNGFGTSSPATKTVTVTVPTAAPTAAFSFLSASGSTTQLRSGHAITFTDTSSGTPTSWLWSFGDGTISTEQNPVHLFTVAATSAPDTTSTFTVTLKASNSLGNTTTTQNLVVHQPEFNLYQGISDRAQSTTVSFSGFALLTGNIYSQTFFPPGKVADYTGFQYLRDNDPSGMGHNTSFVTRVACNVINLLSTDQIAQLAAVATSQKAKFQEYGYKRYTLMQAFRRLLDGNLPTGTSGLSVDAIKAYSNALYQIDGQISYDRALLYANIIKNLSAEQLAYLDAMKGQGWANWPEVTMDSVRDKMSGLPQDTNVLVMTYAGDIYSWYEGSVDADVYFCPERHGTYYGGFYMKDAPAIGHEGYAISTTLTAEAGNILLGMDSENKNVIGQAPYYITQAQADLMAGLVVTQKNNLYAGTTSIVSLRTQIATLLRTLLVAGTDADEVLAQVLSLSGTYGELDGENNTNYATVFASVYQSLTADQKTALAALRASIMTGTYSDGTSFDFTTCSQYYLYSDKVTSTDVADYVSDTATDALFK